MSSPTKNDDKDETPPTRNDTSSDLVRFSVDAGLIDRLGLELVSKQETAVAELIKNGYDADATRVSVVFENTGQPGGKVTISDDGNGMTREELIQGFMRISTRFKVEAPMSPLYQRRRAGRKGIGRFATQRLGRKLVLTSQARGSIEKLILSIDWDRFSAELDLDSVALPLKVVTNNSRTHGTSLEISGLREAWSDAQILRSYRHIQALLRPDPVRLMQIYRGLSVKPVKHGDTGSFSVDFLWQERGGDLRSADEASMFLEHALAAVDAYVDQQGTPQIHFRSTKFGLDENLVMDDDVGSAFVPAILKDLSGCITLHAWYFIWTESPRLLKQRIQQTLSEQGGIRLYRNGFRVLPYGEPGDDWLDLDASYNRRELLPPHANRNFFGLVTINDPDGKLFNETASREGLITTPHFHTLVTFCQKALIATSLRVASLRGKKEKSGKPAGPTTAQRLRDAAHNIRSSVLQPDTKEPSAALRSNQLSLSASPELDRAMARHASQVLLAARLVDAAADEVAGIEANYLDEVAALRVLASLGLLIGEFSHEIRHLVLAVSVDLQELLNGTGSQALTAPLRSLVTRVQKNFSALVEQAAYFDNAIADQAQRQTKPVDLRVALAEFARTVRNRAATAGIILELDPLGSSLVVTPMHKAEWQSILLNLYNNAERAIRRRGGPGRVRMACRRDGDKIVLRVSDDGIGVPVHIRSRIFDPFFTTTVGVDTSGPGGGVVAGTGLGLHIVRQIIESRSGTIELRDSPSADFKTTFEVIVPAYLGEEHGSHNAVTE